MSSQGPSCSQPGLLQFSKFPCPTLLSHSRHLERVVKDVFWDNYRCHCYVKSQAQPLDKKRRAYHEPGKQQPWPDSSDSRPCFKAMTQCRAAPSSSVLSKTAIQPLMCRLRASCRLFLWSPPESALFSASIHLHFQRNKAGFQWQRCPRDRANSSGKTTAGETASRVLTLT